MDNNQKNLPNGRMMYEFLLYIEATGQQPDPQRNSWPEVQTAFNNYWIQPKRERIPLPPIGEPFPKMGGHVVQYWDQKNMRPATFLYRSLELTYWGVIELERLKKLWI